jgi:hypothetical protein
MACSGQAQELFSRLGAEAFHSTLFPLYSKGLTTVRYSRRALVHRKQLSYKLFN